MELRLNRTLVGLALASTSLEGQDHSVAGKLVDPKAKPWGDGVSGSVNDYAAAAGFASLNR